MEEKNKEELFEIKEMIDQLKSRIHVILSNYRPIMNGEIYLSSKDVCKILHINKRTLQQYRNDSIFPYIQIGGKIYFKQSEIIESLSKNYKSIQ